MLIQAQAQLSNKLLKDQCQTNGHNLIGSECHTGTQAQLSNKLLKDQCQTNGHNLIGSKCHTGTEAQLSNKLSIYQCKISRHNTILYVSTRTKITLNTVIKANSQTTNMYLQNILHVKFLYLFTIYSQIYIIVVKLISIRSQSSCITSFYTNLRISSVRIINNVQRNSYRYVQTVFITYHCKLGIVILT